jgi:hypothetical protein
LVPLRGVAHITPDFFSINLPGPAVPLQKGTPSLAPSPLAVGDKKNTP